MAEPRFAPMHGSREPRLPVAAVACALLLLASRPMHPRTRYGGAYLPKEQADVDNKPEIDKACHPKCLNVWATYTKCEARIEEKVCLHDQASVCHVLTNPVMRAYKCPWVHLLYVWQGSGNCSGYYMDYFRFVPRYITPKCAVLGMWPLSPVETR